MRKLKIGDYFILALVAGLILFLFSQSYSFSGSEQFVEITGIDFRASYELGMDQVVEVAGPLGVTRVVIEGGAAFVEDSPCRDKVCIRMGRVSRHGEEAVCLPNRVIVQVAGGTRGIDGVSR
jgi:hypothetical protein